MALAGAADGTLLTDGLAGSLFAGGGQVASDRDRHSADGAAGAEELCDAVTTLARVFYSRTVVKEVPAPSWWRRVVDRTLDIVVATLLLLVLLPLLLLLVGVGSHQHAWPRLLPPRPGRAERSALPRPQFRHWNTCAVPRTRRCTRRIRSTTLC